MFVTIHALAMKYLYNLSDCVAKFMRQTSSLPEWRIPSRKLQIQADPQVHRWQGSAVVDCCHVTRWMGKC